MLTRFKILPVHFIITFTTSLPHFHHILVIPSSQAPPSANGPYRPNSSRVPGHVAANPVHSVAEDTGAKIAAALKTKPRKAEKIAFPKAANAI